jgi:hypothetical protein
MGMKCERRSSNAALEAETPAHDSRVPRLADGALLVVRRGELLGDRRQQSVLRKVWVLMPYVITNDENGYLQKIPRSLGGWLLVEQYCTDDPAKALRFEDQRAAYQFLHARGIKVFHWRVVPCR